MTRRVLCVPILLAVLAIQAPAQATTRDSAFALFDRGNHREAIPFFERLVAANPSDRSAHEHLGLLLLETSGTAAEGKLQRARARSMFAKAVALGSKDVQILSLLEAIPEDGGSDAVFSDNKKVNDAMTQAESAFSAGDTRTALTQYQKTLQLDPAMYSAAVFSGDCYLRLQLIDSAYIWYARATSINPNRETAWRYWSDVLLKHDQNDAALEKAIEAVIAEPYSRISRQGLTGWANKLRTPVGLPKVILPLQDTAAVHAPAWVAYDSVRRAWRGSDAKGGEQFVANFPNEHAYRHSVIEEKAALQAAYRAGGDNAAIVNLKLLDDAGLLEPFIFFARADAGIAGEYAAWSRDHHDLSRKFWTEYVVGAKYSR